MNRKAFQVLSLKSSSKFGRGLRSSNIFLTILSKIGNKKRLDLAYDAIHYPIIPILAYVTGDNGVTAQT
jgi:hypothetical protein